jgi:fatty-acyl-CoA synthase
MNDIGLGRGPANFAPPSPLTSLPRTTAIHPDRVAVVHGDRRIERARAL